MIRDHVVEVETTTDGCAYPCGDLWRLCHRPDSECGRNAPRARSETEVRFSERSRMGRELHDSTAQTLIALQLKILYLKQMLDDTAHYDVIADVEETMRQLHLEIRAVSFINSLPPFDPGMLPAALRIMAARFGRLTGLDIFYRSRGSYAALPSPSETSLYRIAQEVLANIFRHAKARNIRMRLDSSAASVRLTIEDDGIGISKLRKAQMAGSGLENIRVRVGELGGKVEIQCTKTGSRFVVTIPQAAHRSPQDASLPSRVADLH